MATEADAVAVQGADTVAWGAGARGFHSRMMIDAGVRRESNAASDNAGARPALRVDVIRLRDYLTLTSVTSKTTATFGGKPVRGSAP
jgi:hypothetical protein